MVLISVLSLELGDVSSIRDKLIAFEARFMTALANRIACKLNLRWDCNDRGYCVDGSSLSLELCVCVCVCAAN